MNWRIGRKIEDISIDFKNSHHEKSCIILGNGPSLTVSVLQKISQKNLFTFVANGFGLIFKKMPVKIHAVCMSNKEAIEKYLALYPEQTLKFVKKMPGKVYKEISNVYQLPFECEHDKGIHKSKFVKDGFFTLDPFKQNYCADTVLLEFCFPLAFFMGFSRIYIGGVDCDYKKGYFVDTYKKSKVPQLKGMLNNDFSIAIPAYQYAYRFLKNEGVEVMRFTESEKLAFIPFISIDEI